MIVKLLEYPTDQEWLGVKQGCLVTIGKKTVINPPDFEWKRDILVARHSPIRYLRFSFLLEGIPSYAATHLCRHVHAHPYVKSQRNDRQNDYNRDSAPQNSPVNMIWDLNGEEIQIVANKRLCKLADPVTREIVKRMCDLVVEKCPEFEKVLVPACEYNGKCHEMFPCEEYYDD